MNKLILIDGNSLLFRAYFAMRPMVTSKGMHTQGVFAFVNMLGKIIKDYEPTHIAVAFDMKSGTFRHDVYKEYKAGRLKTPPELLSQMMALMDEGNDVVYGQRRRRTGENWFKLATAKLFYRLLQRLVDVAIPMDTGDFRLMSRRALNHLNSMPEHFRFVRGMVSWIGLRQAPLPYDRDARFAGATHYPVRRMIRLALDAVTSFSTVPLRFASHLGFLMGALGVLALGYTLWSWASGNAVPGWTSLAVLILIIGSGQFMVLGIFGEYLGRMYMEAKRRPLYIVNEIHASPATAEVDDARALQENLRKALRA